VAGFKFATAGVLYAVLVAFAIIVVWQRLSDADANVAREAGAAATMYRLAKGIGGETETSVSSAVTRYLNATIVDEWPAMERGRESPVATHALDNLYDELLRYTPGDRRGEVILSELLHQLDVITTARRARLVEAEGSVPGVVWVILFGGAMVTIGFTFFFGTANLRAQVLMTGALSLLVFSGLLIIVVVDRPFAGAVKVGPEALTAVVQDFGGWPVQQRR
jgi:hypothetical protein